LGNDLLKSTARRAKITNPERFMASPNMLQKDARIIGNKAPDGSRIFARQSISSIARTSALDIC
jgi:hypothetical protein